MTVGFWIGWRPISWRLRAIATWSGSRAISRRMRKTSGGGWGRMRPNRTGSNTGRWRGRAERRAGRIVRWWGARHDPGEHRQGACMAGTIDRQGYRYIPGPFQYSAGVAALPGHAIQRVRFANPVPLAE